jgi:hypothetical protein
MVIWAVRGKRICLSLGECGEEVVVLGRDNVPEVVDVIRWIRERCRKFRERGRGRIVRAKWQNGCIGGEAAEDVAKGYNESGGTWEGSCTSECRRSYEGDVRQ